MGRKIFGHLIYGVTLVAFVIYGFTGNARFLFFTLGGGAIFHAICLFISKRVIIKNGVYTDAIVVETVRKRMDHLDGSGSGFTYFPVFKYDVDGSSHTVQDNMGSAKPKYEDGETVKILYNKKDVTKIIIAGDYTFLIFAIVFSLIGLFMLGLGFFGVRLN